MPQLEFPMESISMHGVYGDEIINFTAINSVNVKRHDSFRVYDVFFVQCTFDSVFEDKCCDSAVEKGKSLNILSDQRRNWNFFIWQKTVGRLLEHWNPQTGNIFVHVCVHPAFGFKALGCFCMQIYIFLILWSGLSKPLPRTLTQGQCQIKKKKSFIWLYSVEAYLEGHSHIKVKVKVTKCQDQKVQIEFFLYILNTPFICVFNFDGKVFLFCSCCSGQS